MNQKPPLVCCVSLLSSGPNKQNEMLLSVCVCVVKKCEKKDHHILQMMIKGIRNSVFTTQHPTIMESTRFFSTKSKHAHKFFVAFGWCSTFFLRQKILLYTTYLPHHRRQGLLHTHQQARKSMQHHHQEGQQQPRKDPKRPRCHL